MVICSRTPFLSIYEGSGREGERGENEKRDGDSDAIDREEPATGGAAVVVFAIMSPQGRKQSSR